jgi:DNA-binding beta-propeller fold protein YncE
MPLGQISRIKVYPYPRRASCSPRSLAFDSSGNLWVADDSNNRVLRYPYSPSPPHFINSKAADLVLGQSSFTTNTAGSGPSGLTQPEGVGFDLSGNVWVVDQGNNRVLSYPRGTITTTTVTLFTTSCGCTTTSTVTQIGPSYGRSWTGLILPLVVIAAIAMGVSYILLRRKLLRRR